MTETKAVAAKEVIEAYLKLGTALRRAGDYPEARRVLRRLLQRQPKDPAAASAYLSLGLISMETGKYQTAVKNFNQALRLASPEDQATRAATAFSLGSAHLRLGHPRRALKGLEQARDLGHDTAELWQQLASCLQQVDRWDEALSALERAIALDPKNARAYQQRAGIFWWVFDRLDEALADFNRAIELDPNDAYTLWNRAFIYRRMKRHPEALDDYNRTIELKPQNVSFIRERGEIYREMGRFSEALNDFNICLKLDPKDAASIIGRGNTYFSMRRFEEALADFSKVIDIDPNQAIALVWRGAVYARLERYQEALADIQRGMELEPNFAAASYAFLGQSNRLQGRYPEALAGFDQAIQLDADYWWAILGRGEARLLSGQFEAALADLNRASKLVPDNNWILYCRALAYKAIGQETEAARDLTAAIRGFRARYEEKPQDLTSIFNIALGHLLAGEVERSKGIYSEALSQGPSPHLLREAVRDLEDLLRIFPKHTQAREMLTWLQERSKPGQATG